MMARELGIDPVEFRRRNLLREGRPQATGTVMRDAAIEKVLDRLAALMDWDKPFERGSGTVRRGRGIAIGFKACVSPTTSLAAVSVNADGSCTVYCSTADMGQGSDTAMAQIAGEVLQHGGRVDHAWCIPTPTSRPTTWRRSARARSSTWATR